MPQATRWWWVRHGPTHEKAMVGWRDVPADLSDHARIDRLKGYLPDDALVVSSDLVRASATADVIEGQNRRLAHTSEFREMNFGDWDGQSFSNIAESDPDLSRSFWETPGDVRAPRGESWNELAVRVSSQVNLMMDTYPGRNIVAVAHIGVILSQVQRAKGLSAYETMAQSIDNLSVTRLDFDGEWRVVDLNHCP